MTTATIKDAFKLFMDGSIALAQVEANGIKVDVDYLDRAIKETTEKVSALEEKLRADRDVFIPWRRRYGNRLNLGSRQQLAEVLVQDLEFDVKERTEKTGRAKMSKNVLEGIDRPFVKAFLRMESLKKVLNTYLVALKREVVNGYFHPNFNIAHARTIGHCSPLFHCQRRTPIDRIGLQSPRSHSGCVLPQR
jgi:DNA polymerase I-like protein with 3'-5' exonuclease and polymerase domains